MNDRLRNGTYPVGIISIISIVIITVTYWNIVHLKGYQSASKEHSTYRAQIDTQNRYYKECLKRKTIDSARECVSSSPYIDRNAQRAEQDLDAQRQMVQWAERMLWATYAIGIATIFAAGVSAYLLFQTLRETRSLNNATSEAFLNDQRPWLGLDTDILPRISPQDDRWILDMDVKVQNFGKSPATNVVGGVKIIIFNPVTNEEFDVQATDEFDVHTQIEEFKNALIARVEEGDRSFPKTVFPNEKKLITQSFKDFNEPIKFGYIGIICYGVGYSFSATNKTFTTVLSRAFVQWADSSGEYLLNMADVFDDEEHTILLGDDGRGSGLHDHNPKNNHS